MKKVMLTLLAAAIAFISVGQTRDDYEQTMSHFKAFYNVGRSDSIFNMFSEGTQAALPADKTRQIIGQLSAQLGDMKSYTLSKSKGALYYYKCDFAKATVSMLISLTKDKKMETFRIMPYTPEKAEKSNLVLTTPTGKIYGTLTVPESKSKVPVVLIIAGSGPTDREGNSSMFGLNCNMYKMLADSLLDAGIACARYDKRGVGESAEVTKAGFDDMIDDAAGLIKMLKDDGRFSKVIVFGHSEGSLIGMVAAERGKAAAYISMAGAGQRIDKVIEWQFGVKSKDAAEKATLVFDSLSKGYLVTNVDSSISFMLGSQMQPYMIAWLKYDPSLEIKKLKMPILIVQGTTDVQVNVSEAQALKKANPAASLRLIQGMNHILKQAPAKRILNTATYSNPDLPLSPELTPTLVTFIAGL